MSNYSRSAIQSMLDEPPAISVHYFYKSTLNIDDPLAPVAPPASNPSSTAGLLLRPFSDLDNTALEEAWISSRRMLLAQRVKSDRSGRVTNTTSFERRPRTAKPPLADAFSHELAPRWEDGRDRSFHGRFNLSGSRRDRSGSARRSIIAFQSGEDVEQRSRPGSVDEATDELEYLQHQVDADVDTHGLTGKPFVRAPARSKLNTFEREDPHNTDHGESLDSDDGREEAYSLETALPVGVARIHQVFISKLAMEPIYWNAVHDRYAVTRATWFYRDTLLPVEADIANLLEKGYTELRPWTQTWNDELNSALEVGALGEEKIAHALWPDLSTADEDTLEQVRTRILDSTCKVIDDATSGPHVDNKAAGTEIFGKDGKEKLYLQSSVIYADERNATILRPSLAPSAYHGRRPYANYISNGSKIGVPVVRGFDRREFEKLHAKSAANTQRNASKRPSGYITEVTDLILVIHGIGQKLSERVESFHFTHAMNTFRREVNVELNEPSVSAHARSGMGGIMVLPVNWRSTLSFEEGGYSEGRSDASQNEFSLKDITPESLPSIRNIISDVMLDIPYYLSHHQPKIISAVIKEANRIYTLWCKNNPGFQENGRVHLIAHSLGSVMALDILSEQPTSVDVASELRASEVNKFLFNTTNLFLCGSPAGFFLLLKRGSLIPRKGRKMSSTEGENLLLAVSRSQGTYGCLAIDNIYNVVNPYDPVAYHLNATIDAAYAASLKPAYVPSSSSSWLSFARALRGSSVSSKAQSAKSARAIQRLPSSVELETHNFTREEIAEKRAYLLNDNGQIDWLLQYGGGPLEIQYLTMLGAHSSYWISQDFIRFVVTETSRKPGRDGTLDGMKATKKKVFSV